MALLKRRYFVKNIPPSSNERDVAAYFKKLGDISEVSIGANAHGKFSFFTVEGLPNKIDQALQKYAANDWNNCQITLELAKKESFMARLKREQAESVKSADLVRKSSACSTNAINSKDVHNKSTGSNNLKTQEKTPNTNKKRSINSSPSTPKSKKHKIIDEHGAEHDENVKLGIEKFTGTLQLYENNQEGKPQENSCVSDAMSSFEAFDSMWGDDEVDENSSSFKSFIRKQKVATENNGRMKGKSKLKEEDRVTPLTKIEKKNRDDLRRKQSLVDRASVIRNQQKIIKMSLAGGECSKNTKIVFDNEDEPLESSQSLKKSLFDDDDEDVSLDITEQPEELIKLQSKFSSDDRFKMDERFLDDEVSYKGENSSSKNKVKEMVRFDPKKPASLEVHNNASSEITKREPGREAPIVSIAKFYEVSEDMKSVLSKKTPGFSLLAAYGSRSTRNDKVETDNEQVRALPRRIRNPFLDDSSDEELDDDGKENDIEKGEEVRKWKPVIHLPSGARDNFFFADKDPLFAEAFQFMNKKNSDEAVAASANFDSTRRELKKIIKEQVLKRSKRAAMFRKKVVGMKKKAGPAQMKRKFATGKKGYSKDR